MKVKDEATWLLQKAELARADDAEIGEQFLSILDEWAELSERAIASYAAQEPDADVDPIWVLRNTLPRVEQNHGALSGLWIFEMILVLDAHWIHGGELYEGLSAFEQAALGDVARRILRSAQEAAETPVAPGSVPG